MMDVLIVLIGLSLVLFGASFMAKRRFGLLGLALASGSLLSGIWGYDAGLIASGLGFPQNATTTAVILSAIVLLPAIILLFHGYVYKSMIGRLVGAAMFTILALALLITPLAHVLIPQGAGASIYNLLVNNKDFITGLGLIAAVVDLFFTKPVQSSDNKHKH